MNSASRGGQGDGLSLGPVGNLTRSYGPSSNNYLTSGETKAEQRQGCRRDSGLTPIETYRKRRQVLCVQWGQLTLIVEQRHYWLQLGWTETKYWTGFFQGVFHLLTFSWFRCSVGHFNLHYLVNKFMLVWIHIGLHGHNCHTDWQWNIMLSKGKAASCLLSRWTTLVRYFQLLITS